MGGLNQKLALISSIVALHFLIPAMKINAQTEVQCVHLIAEKYCASGVKVTKISLALNLYILSLQDILEKYDIKITPTNYLGDTAPKANQKLVEEFGRLCLLTRKYCESGGYQFKEIISRANFYTGSIKGIPRVVYCEAVFY